MPRAKRGVKARRRRKRILKLARGMYASRRTTIA
jgi:ribosomal protein L20